MTTLTNRLGSHVKYGDVDGASAPILVLSTNVSV